MFARIWTAYSVEVVKALRQRQTYLGPALVILVLMCGPLVHPIERDGVSDYGFIAYVTPLALNTVGFVVLLAYCSGLMASEMGDGSIRQVLVRPVRRYEYVLAKLLMGVSYAIVLSLIAVGGAWGLAYGLGELRGVTYGGELVYAAEAMRNAHLLGALLGLAPLCAGAAYALLISTCTRNPLTAVSAGVGIWIVLDVVKYPLGIAPFVFTTYLESPWHVFAQRCEAMDAAWFPMAWYCLATSAAVFGASTALAAVIMQRRNLPG